MNKKTNEIQLLKEFAFIARDILHSEPFIEMKKYKHHVKGTLYDHSVKVAYLCFKHIRHFGLHIDPRELVRGALLHDYYLYNLHVDSASHRYHWFKHPKIALQNALEKYPELTPLQKDMIKHHMFPLTLVPPSTGAGWLICFYDKIAAIDDRFGTNKRKRTPLYIKERGKRKYDQGKNKKDRTVYR